jgi:hypothetical protein
MKEPNIHDELKDLAPGLAKMQQGEGYSVPPTYFRDMQNKVMSQVLQEEQKAPAGSWLRNLVEQYFSPRYALAIATVAIVIVAAVVYNGQGSDNELLASITEEDAFEYVFANIDEYEIMDIYALSDEGYAGITLDDLSDEDLDFAIDALIDDIGSESLDQLY